MICQALKKVCCDNGEYVSFILPMREIDDKKHHEYFNMSARAFDDLLSQISPLISHHKAHNDPVNATERLASLHFLTTGVSFQALSMSFKLRSATAGCIVSEVSTAIWTVLKDKFVTFPNKDLLKQIYKDFCHF